MTPMISDNEMILRLVTAALLGGVIGFERERLSWVAGLRTHMLVCVGSALIMIVSQYGFNGVLNPPYVSLDPSRVAAQVVSGIGFLGAGTILFLKNVVRGLTTAASLWSVAAVGLAAGGGLYLAAIFVTLLIFFILAAIKPLEKKFMKRSHELGLRIHPKDGSISLASLEELLGSLKLRFGPCTLQIDKSGEQEIIYIMFSTMSQSNMLAVMDEVKSFEGIGHIELITEAAQVES
jgi:putative Mg2+ transporter-C (MgtC) family protein